MNNADMPAMPLTDAEQWWDPTKPELGTYYANGLTKCEHFAGLAMQAILSNQAMIDEINDSSIDWVVKSAERVATALLAELDKVQQ
jgi:hypothetical protein